MNEVESARASSGQAGNYSPELTDGAPRQRNNMKNLKHITVATLALCSVLGSAQTYLRNRDHTEPGMHARYGGGVYLGPPRLDVTSSLIYAGGGIENFSVQRFLRSTEGDEWTNTELESLRFTYGREKVRLWERAFDFAVADSARRATDEGITLPIPSMRGRRLAMALVNAGIDENHRFTAETWMDRTVSNSVHKKVLDDLDLQYGPDATGDFHQISNRMFYDLALHLNMDQIKLAWFN